MMMQPKPATGRLARFWLCRSWADRLDDVLVPLHGEPLVRPTAGMHIRQLPAELLARRLIEPGSGTPQPQREQAFPRGLRPPGRRAAVVLELLLSCFHT